MKFTDHRLEALVTILFSSDFSAPDIEALETLESHERLLGMEAEAFEQDIPDFCYSPKRSIAIAAEPSPRRDIRRSTFSTFLAATLARGFSKHESFTVAIQRGDSKGGPYIRLRRFRGTIEASLFANFRLIDTRERWFESASHLLGWHTSENANLTSNVYRKVWSNDEDLADVALAVALVVTTVFDAFVEEGAVVFVPLLQDEIFDFVETDRQLRFYDDDETVVPQVFEFVDILGFHPDPSASPASFETVNALHNIEDALRRARDENNAVAVQMFTQLKHDIETHDAHFKTMTPALHTFLELSENLPSTKRLPAISLRRGMGSSAIITDVDPEYDTISIGRATSAGVFALKPAFTGEVHLSAENEDDDDVVMAIALGWLINQIGDFDRALYEPFLEMELQDRANASPPDSGVPVRYSDMAPGMRQGFYVTKHGMMKGALRRLQHRVSQVFDGLCALQASASSPNDHHAVVKSLSDQVILDLLVWTWNRNAGSLRGRRYPAEAFERIRAVSSFEP